MRAGAAICFVLALGAIGTWIATGMHFATRTELPPEPHLSCAEASDCGEDNVCTDGKCFDDFGDPVAGTEWQEGFELGLVDGAGPAAGGLIGLGVVLLILDRRKRKAAAS